MAMDMRTTTGAILSGWHLIVVGVLAASAVAVWIDASTEPVYSAEASYVVSPGSGIEPDDIARGVDTLDSSRSRSIMATLTEITNSAVVRDEAFDALGLDSGLADDYTIESVVVPEANVMQTTVVGPDPTIAASLASALGEFGGTRFVASYRIYDVEVLDPAEIPAIPANPELSALLVVAGAMGLVAGVTLALLRFAWRSRRDRSVEQRLSAYRPEVTPIEEHSRYKRVG